MIAYSQCWEDALVLQKALQINKNDVVVSITSGGCNTFSLAENNPQKIYAIDSNKYQNYLFELKIAAVKELNLQEVIQFFGYTKNNNRIETFHNIKKHLSSDADLYWSNNLKMVKAGIVHCGMFEQYLALFRKKILPLIHNKKRITDLLSPKSKTEQKQFYLSIWESYRWRLLFKIFFSKAVMSGRGRKKEMFAQNTRKSVSKRYYERTKNALMYGEISNNFYLSYILDKEQRLFPPFLCNLSQDKSLELNNIDIVYSDLLSFLRKMPDNSISKFNLSDIFEPLPVLLQNEIFKEIYRTSKPNAGLIFLNNLVERDIPKELKEHFVREHKPEQELIPQNHVFFYERFLIYHVHKVS